MANVPVQILNFIKLQATPGDTKNEIIKRRNGDTAKKQVKDGTVISMFLNITSFSVFLPPLDKFPHIFKLNYIRCVIDLDMKNDLQNLGVLNWCKDVKKLYPVITSG